MRAHKHIFHVTAEMQPIAKVGGLGEATAGLAGALTELGWNIEPVLPDYGSADTNGIVLIDEIAETLDVPAWAGKCWSRRGTLPGVGRVTLIGSKQIRRPHPYVDPATGESWPDNDERFFAFAAGVAAVVRQDPPDLVHFHDWHGAAAACLLPAGVPTVLTIHNLAHQGTTSDKWLATIGPAAKPMRVPGSCVPLVGAIRLADAIVAVSPTYRHESEVPGAEGVGEIVAAREPHVFGIINGIDPTIWDPWTDPRIPYGYKQRQMQAKGYGRRKLLDYLGASQRSGPIIAVIARMAAQKGIDLALSTARLIEENDGVLVLHGAGQHDICALAHETESLAHGHVAVIDGYDETTAHRLLAGADMLLMASRFEPCGLTQLQAMTYGTIPIVTNVGGLHDTVIDNDLFPDTGTGFVSPTVNTKHIGDAVARAIATWHDRTSWSELQYRAMDNDWSWDQPALEYEHVYQSILGDASAAAMQNDDVLIDLTAGAHPVTGSTRLSR